MTMFVHETEVQPCEAPQWSGDTHILAWIPPSIGDGDGFWELQPVAVFEEWVEGGHVPGHFTAMVLVAPRESTGGELAPLVAGVVGYRVALTPGSQEIRVHRHWGAWHTEPLYYVSPER